MRKNEIIEMGFNWLMENDYVDEDMREGIMESLEWYYDNCLNEEFKEKESKERVMMEVVECLLDDDGVEEDDEE